MSFNCLRRRCLKVKKRSDEKRKAANVGLPGAVATLAGILAARQNRSQRFKEFRGLAPGQGPATHQLGLLSGWAINCQNRKDNNAGARHAPGGRGDSDRPARCLVEHSLHFHVALRIEAIRSSDGRRRSHCVNRGSTGRWLHPGPKGCKSRSHEVSPSGLNRPAAAGRSVRIAVVDGLAILSYPTSPTRATTIFGFRGERVGVSRRGKLEPGTKIRQKAANFEPGTVCGGHTVRDFGLEQARHMSGNQR